MTRYLVTGAAGFIGCNLVRALLDRGEQVVGLDNFSTGRRSNLEGLSGLELIEGDMTDLDTTLRAMDGVEYVLHQAAIPSVPRSVADPLPSHHAIATGTLVVLEAARKAGTVRRVVCASSSSVYGDTPVLPKVETMPPTPQSPYAVAKLAAEHYIRVYTKLHGLPCVALRYFNVFGPRQDPNSKYAAVMPKFIGCILNGEPPPVFGDGLQTRDFTYIDSVVEANLKACIAQDAPGEAFNIACGSRIGLLTVVELINRILDRDVSPTFLPPRPGDIRDSYADVSKARRLLGYEGATTLEEGLRRYIEWFVEHPE